jgi:hypothetical protein
MSKTKTIELTEPIKDHRGMIKKIVFREPRYSDFIDLGMPTTWVSLADGGGFSQETPSVLGAWIERTVWQRPRNMGGPSTRLRHGTGHETCRPDQGMCLNRSPARSE